VADHAEAVLLTGLFGTGKSTVAIEVADTLEKRDMPYAVLDLDWLCWGYAGAGEAAEHRMLLANLAPVVTNFRVAGARFFILARSIRSREELDGVRDTLAMPLRVVRLTAPWAEIERRLQKDVTGARQDDLRDAAAWRDAGLGEGIEDRTVDNGDRPLHEVAAEIIAWLGWSIGPDSQSG
jgi:adenylylsulfate kinase-like enzyme